MKKNFLIILVLFGIGCSGVKVQTTPTFEDMDTGKETNFTTMKITDTNAFSASTSITIVLQCEPPAGEWAKPKCRPSNAGYLDSAPGVVSGFGATVLNSAAIVGASIFIGEGIGDSGDSDSSSFNQETLNSGGGQNAQIGDYNEAR